MTKNQALLNARDEYLKLNAAYWKAFHADLWGRVEDLELDLLDAGEAMADAYLEHIRPLATDEQFAIIERIKWEEKFWSKISAPGFMERTAA